MSSGAHLLGPGSEPPAPPSSTGNPAHLIAPGCSAGDLKGNTDHSGPAYAPITGPNSLTTGSWRQSTGDSKVASSSASKESPKPRPAAPRRPAWSTLVAKDPRASAPVALASTTSYLISKTGLMDNNDPRNACAPPIRPPRLRRSRLPRIGKHECAVGASLNLPMISSRGPRQ